MKGFFTKATISIFCCIFMIFGLLLTIQVFTGDYEHFDWQTILMIGILYFVLLNCFFIGTVLFRLLNKAANKTVFSSESLILFKQLRFSLLLIVLAVFGLLPKFYQQADLTDSPGIMLFGGCLMMIPLAIYVLSSILCRLLEEAIFLKNEFDFTV